jgi:aryl-alcohol dehydrogenase-like predicted oxidoreductase
LTAVQSEYSIMERVFEHDVIPASAPLGIGFVRASPPRAAFWRAR